MQHSPAGPLKRMFRFALRSGLLLGMIMISVIWIRLDIYARQAAAERLQTATERTVNVAKIAQLHVLNVIGGADRTVVRMRKLLERKSENLDFSALFRDGMINDNVVQVGFVDKTGVLRQTSMGLPDTPINIADRDYFVELAAATDDRLVISKPVVGRAHGLAMIQVARPMFSADGAFNGIVTATIDPAQLSKLYQQINLGEKGTITLLGRDGIVRAHGAARENTLGRSMAGSQLLQEIANAPSGTFRGTSVLDGVERIVSFESVPPYDLVVTAAMSTDEVFAAMRAEHRHLTIAAAILTLIILLCNFLMFRSYRSLTKAKRELELKSTRLNVTLEHMQQGIILVDADGHVPVISDRAIQLMGCSKHFKNKTPTLEELRHDLIARGEIAMDHSRIDPRFGESMTKRHNLDHALLYERTRPNGMVLEVAAFPIPGGGFIRTFTDITEKKRVDRELRDSKRKSDELAEIARMTDAKILTTDAERRITWANDAFCRAFEVELPSILGKSPNDVIRSPSSFDMAATFEKARVEFTQGRHAYFEQPCVKPDGTIMWLAVAISPVFGEAGEIIKYISAATDITEVKRQEEVIARYSKDIEQFAHIASHDLQEPLRKITTHAAILRDALRDNEMDEVNRCLGVLTAAGMRGRNLVGDLLRYSKLKNQPVNRKPADSKQLANQVLEQFSDARDQNAACLSNNMTGCLLNCDEPLIAQVLQNLIGNALKYRSPERPPLVTLSDGFDASGQYVMRIADNGIGFDMANHNKIFEPFKRLVSRDEYAGTGIGLSLVASILDKHGWRIEADSEIGAGSTFTIIVPAADYCAAPGDPTARQAKAA